MAEQFDMFSGEVARDRAVPRDTPKTPGPGQHAVGMNEVDMVRHLLEMGRYRILTKLVPRAIAPFRRPEYPLTAIILDTETTGLDHARMRSSRLA